MSCEWRWRRWRGGWWMDGLWWCIYWIRLFLSLKRDIEWANNSQYILCAMYKRGTVQVRKDF